MMEEEYALVDYKNREMFESIIPFNPYPAAPLKIKMHLFSWWPVFIRTPRRRWVWLRRYTRWLIWMGNLQRYRTIDTQLGRK